MLYFGKIFEFVVFNMEIFVQRFWNVCPRALGEEGDRFFILSGECFTVREKSCSFLIYFTSFPVRSRLEKRPALFVTLLVKLN